jgi:hypothetical protein
MSADFLFNLKSAIFNLDLDTVRVLVNSMGIKAIVQHHENIIMWTLYQLATISPDNEGEVTIRELGFNHFNGPYPDSITRRRNLFIFIIEYLAQKLKLLITDRVIECCEYYGADILCNVLMRESRMKACGECGVAEYEYKTLSHHKKLVDYTCACVGKAHISCMFQIIKSQGNICNRCQHSRNGYAYDGNRFCYPQYDIYPDSGTSYIMCTNEVESLRLAASFVMVDRVRTLLLRLKRDVMIRYLCDIRSYNVHKIERGNLILVVHQPNRTKLEYRVINQMFNDKIKKLRLKRMLK